jgi:Haem-binding domain/Cytochrome P460
MALSKRLRVLIVLAAMGAVVFAVMQLIRPSLGNPPVAAEIQAPAEVKAVLRGSCYSCHSNETKLPWFDQVVPAYWLVAHDVKEAREHLNFSEIGKLPAAQQKATLFEAVNMIQMSAMPLPSYLKVHPDAVVKPEQLEVLRKYLSTPAPAPDAAAIATAASAADAQYGAWIAAAQTQKQVQAEWNGVAFMPEYKGWQPISSTDRWDNHTMREILGNDVAVKAIAENRINPWPDGTVFAKVAWQQAALDGQGVVKTGAFIQVELMIKDSKKYAATDGWGWGRWRGPDLKPYGTDAKFQNECTGCHEPVAKNDYVYTMPIGGVK